MFVKVDAPTDINDNNNNELPLTYALSQNYPIPFNPSTTINYALPKLSHVTLKIYNILGQEVINLIDQKQSAGNYTFVWDGKIKNGNLAASGIYLYRIVVDDFVASKKMVLIK